MSVKGALAHDQTLDDAQELIVNLQMKTVLNSFDPGHIEQVAQYLRHRAILAQKPQKGYPTGNNWQTGIKVCVKRQR